MGRSAAGSGLLKTNSRRRKSGSGASRSEADAYISQYNIWMFHVLDPNGRRLVSPEVAAAESLEPSRRNQGQTMPIRNRDWRNNAPSSRSWNGSSRRASPESRRQQSQRRLESMDQRSELASRMRQRSRPRRRVWQISPIAEPARATPCSWKPTRRPGKWTHIHRRLQH